MILINKSYIISSPFSSLFKTSNGDLSSRKGIGLCNHSLKVSSEVCNLLPKDHIKSDTPSTGDFTSCPLKINSCLSVSINFFIDILFTNKELLFVFYIDALFTDIFSLEPYPCISHFPASTFCASHQLYFRLSPWLLNQPLFLPEFFWLAD